ncbi:MAG: zf-HC2 domain-containing protein [Planctomycetes bacterium]|nr:zf-HC2 domain-containing protein [Planctomycetota bacterium]
MNCEEVVKSIPALVLDELDVEVRRVVETHLESCGACRREREREDHALRALRAFPDVETSAARRDAAVAAMSGARDELIERSIMRRPARWGRWAGAAAAVVVLAVSAAWLSWPSAGWQVTSVQGTASVRAGARVKSGDVISSHEDGAVILTFKTGSVELAAMTSVEILGQGNLRLLSGSVRVTSDEKMTIVNPWNEVAVVEGVATVVSDRRAVGGSVVGQDPPQVRFEGDSLRASVERGQATLWSAGGSVRLGAGERARVDERRRPIVEK